MSCWLVFHAMSKEPERPPDGWSETDALLLNPCDGYHHVFARWSVEDGEFRGFFNFLGTCRYDDPGHPFVAWALLPDSLPLTQHFKGD